MELGKSPGLCRRSFPVQSYTVEKQGDRMALPAQMLILPVCCVCGLVRDQGGPDMEEQWLTKVTYRQTHGVDPAVCRITHTYCPDCYTQFMNRIAAA